MTLWFFRTPGGAYGLSRWEMNSHDMQTLDSAPSRAWQIVAFGKRKPRGLPPLDTGECIPVKLVAEGK